MALRNLTASRAHEHAIAARTTKLEQLEKSTSPAGKIYAAAAEKVVRAAIDAASGNGELEVRNKKHDNDDREWLTPDKQTGLDPYNSGLHLTAMKEGAMLAAARLEADGYTHVTVDTGVRDRDRDPLGYPLTFQVSY